jgi:hypothetical protein
MKNYVATIQESTAINFSTTARLYNEETMSSLDINEGVIEDDVLACAKLSAVEIYSTKHPFSKLDHI